jgi:hypothetical protein
MASFTRQPYKQQWLLKMRYYEHRDVVMHRACIT